MYQIDIIDIIVYFNLSINNFYNNNNNKISLPVTVKKRDKISYR